MQGIRADEISKIIRQQIEGYSTSVEVSEVGQVISAGDGIAEIYGLERVMAGELLDLPYEVAGIALAEVTTAAPASQSAQDSLTRKLQELVGKQVQVQFKTDPALIGGAVTRLESVVYDGSIRTQLQAVKQRLKEGTV